LDRSVTSIGNMTVVHTICLSFTLWYTSSVIGRHRIGTNSLGATACRIACWPSQKSTCTSTHGLSHTTLYNCKNYSLDNCHEQWRTVFW